MLNIFEFYLYTGTYKQTAISVRSEGGKFKL